MLARILQCHTYGCATHSSFLVQVYREKANLEQGLKCIGNDLVRKVRNSWQPHSLSHSLSPSLSLSLTSILRPFRTALIEDNVLVDTTLCESCSTRCRNSTFLPGVVPLLRRLLNILAFVCYDNLYLWCSRVLSDYMVWALYHVFVVCKILTNRPSLQ